ncbi:MAG: UDP-N-acetylglucosamine 2-epimerase [Solirubrobacterales bacterium]|nr:UDP-N-acetylglucosamine 2-epimerase [Solirubrobacterales bacterium]
MIAIVYGTTGELIKLAPLVIELRRRESQPLMLCSGQQVSQIPGFQRDLGLPPVDLWLATGSGGADLDRKSEIPGWATQVAVTVARRRGALCRSLHADDRAPFLLVHGDTMTTVLGALTGRMLGVPVGHVEAGLRSGDWRNPFPEEINRRLAARLVDVHFAPGARAVANLRREGAGGDIVDTRQNTIRDAVDLVDASRVPALTIPEEPFGLVSLHRFELIERPAQLRALLELLHAHSRRQPLLFVDHSTTTAVIDRSRNLRALFDDRFRRIPRQPYLQFIALLRRSEFLVSDSGGSQEECAFLGLPCVIHRAVSERDTGIGSSVLLSRLNLDAVADFLADPQRWRARVADPGDRPSARIADELARRGALH